MQEKIILENGLNIVIEKDNSSKIATFCYLVNCGSFNEDDSNRGIAHFTEHMLFKGTTNRNFSDINKDIEKVGGMLNAETSYDYTRFYSIVPADKWEIGLDIISDIIWNNTIPQEEFEKEKNVVIEELIMYEDDPQEKAMENFNIMINEGYENRKRIGGTPETVSNIIRDDMISFIDKYYTPNNITLVITGNVDKKEILNFLDNYLNTEITLSKKDEIEKIDILNINGSEVTTKFGNINQSHVVFGTIGPVPSSNEYIVLEVISNYLGGNSSSKLYHRIREIEGFAYTVYTRIESLFDSSQFIGYIGTNKNNIEKCKEIIFEELNAIIKNGISEDELLNSINSLKGNTLLALEKCSSKNSYLCNCIICKCDPSLDNYFKQLENITIEDIKNVTNKYLNKNRISFSYVISED